MSVCIDGPMRLWIGDVNETAPRNATHSLFLGQDLKINSEEISRYCGGDVPPFANDLASLCGAIVYADRLVSRKRSEGWGRQFEIEIPLEEFPHFDSGEIRLGLEELLHFLTGDSWALTFRQRNRRYPIQHALPLGTGFAAAIPFSGGMDSFAAYRLLESAHGERSILRVTTSRRTALHHSSVMPMRVPFAVPDKKREGSYRTRVFPYFVFAALAAVASKCNRVVIGENGQGSFGPALTPFRDEWPFRSCHPAFVQLLQKWVSVVFERSVIFDQPFLARTKGNVLAELSEKHLAQGWELTRSCSADTRQGFGSVGCGFCGGCVLRRVALSAAKVSPNPERYAFQNWDAETPLVTSFDAERVFGRTEREIASYAVRSMSEFATLDQSEVGRRRMELDAQQISVDRKDEWLKTIEEVQRAHNEEWKLVMDALPVTSWVRQVAEGLA